MPPKQLLIGLLEAAAVRQDIKGHIAHQLLRRIRLEMGKGPSVGEAGGWVTSG